MLLHFLSPDVYIGWRWASTPGSPTRRIPWCPCYLSNDHKSTHRPSLKQYLTWLELFPFKMEILTAVTPARSSSLVSMGIPYEPTHSFPPPSGDSREVEIHYMDLWAPRPRCLRSRAPPDDCSLLAFFLRVFHLLHIQIFIEGKIQIFILYNSSNGRSDEGVGGRGGAVII